MKKHIENVPEADKLHNQVDIQHQLHREKDPGMHPVKPGAFDHDRFVSEEVDELTVPRHSVI